MPPISPLRCGILPIPSPGVILTRGSQNLRSCLLHYQETVAHAPQPCILSPIVTQPRGTTIPKPRRPKPSNPLAPHRFRRYLGPTLVVLAAALALTPLFLRGPARGTDLGFHFITWIDAAHALSTLTLPHWSPSPNFGAGEPRFLFYPPLSLMLGAIFGLILPWPAVPLVLSFLFLAATGLAVRALAREQLADAHATLAGCAVIFLGYALFNIYKRCDYSELLAAAFIPLLLLYALRRRNPTGPIARQVFDGSAAPLALIIAAIWLSNGPVGIMAAYLLAAVAITSSVLEKSFVPILRAIAATLLGMALAAIYLLPAIVERKYVSLHYALDQSNFAIESSWLYARHADPDMASHDLFLHRVSTVAVVMLIIFFASATIVWLRRTLPGPRRWYLPLALIPPTVLILLLPISHPIWNYLPELRLLQFPWRWLVVLEAPMAIAFAAALWPAEHATISVTNNSLSPHNVTKPVTHTPGPPSRYRPIVVTAFCIALFAGSVAISQLWFLDSATFESELQESVRQDLGVLGKPEYAPPGIHYPQVDRIVPAACLLDTPASQSPTWNGDTATCSTATWRQLALLAGANSIPYMQDSRRIAGTAAHPGFLILRLRYYPAWSVTVNGAPVTPLAETERGFLAVPVPQGNVVVTVNWTTTPDILLARAIALAALLLLALLYTYERRLQP